MSNPVADQKKSSSYDSDGPINVNVGYDIDRIDCPFVAFLFSSGNNSWVSMEPLEQIGGHHGAMANGHGRWMLYPQSPADSSQSTTEEKGWSR